MPEDFTISTVMATGKTSQMFGQEYYVKFAESEQTFTLWFKPNTPHDVGDKVYGHIEGSRFKKDKRDDQQQSFSGGQSNPAPKREFNQDGMRQGMCFNNAAAYVLNVSSAPMTPKEWADAVRSYAKALYDASDLAVDQSSTETVQTDLAKEAKEVFGIK